MQDKERDGKVLFATCVQNKKEKHETTASVFVLLMQVK